MMKLDIDNDQKNYIPGQQISGTVVWEDFPPETTHLEVRLIWYTQGKGTRDFELMAAVRLECANLPKGQQAFQFVAPHRPSSFSGSKLSVVWGLELIDFPSKESMITQICISPTGQEIRLEKDFDDEAKATTFFRSSQ